MNVKRLLYGLPFLGGMRVRRAESAFPRKSVPEGFTLHTRPDFGAPGWEEVERKAAAHYLQSCAGLVDVGANHGFYSLMAAHMGKPALAFEPEKVNLSVLRRNVPKSVTIIPAAVSDKAGTVEIYGDGDMASVHRRWQNVAPYFRQRVRSVTLDSFAADWLHGQRLFIKIDVEGAEDAVLRGASITLKRDAIWMIETLPKIPGGARNPAHRITLEIMEKAGFSRIELSAGNYLFTR